jgi:hypothetical protein
VRLQRLAVQNRLTPDRIGHQRLAPVAVGNARDRGLLDIRVGMGRTAPNTNVLKRPTLTIGGRGRTRN